MLMNCCIVATMHLQNLVRISPCPVLSFPCLASRWHCPFNFSCFRILWLFLSLHLIRRMCRVSTCASLLRPVLLLALVLVFYLPVLKPILFSCFVWYPNVLASHTVDRLCLQHALLYQKLPTNCTDL